MAAVQAAYSHANAMSPLSGGVAMQTTCVGHVLTTWGTRSHHVEHACHCVLPAGMTLAARQAMFPPLSSWMH
jgi:hypothetical protein